MRRDYRPGEGPVRGILTGLALATPAWVLIAILTIAVVAR